MITTTTSFAGSDSIPASLVRRRRRINRQTGQALEKLAHAIEYLSSEFLHNDTAPYESRLEAIEILRNLNREIYLASPERPTLRHRAAALLRHLVEPVPPGLQK